MIPYIDLESQYHRIAATLQERLQRVFAHTQFVLGPEVEELETALARYVGARHCISLASGTDALMAALLALDIGPGDEVVTPAFSFIAPAEVTALLGATPVFVDVDPQTFNLDPQRLEPALSTRTRAIVPVNLFGQCADYDAINAIAARHQLPVIEDAAQSLGATYRGRRSGGLATIGCTSFFPAKPLGAYGEGGACFTDDDDLAQRLLQIRNHGQDGRYRHVRLGLNARLDTLQAAVLLAKLEIFPDEVQARAKIGERYTRLILEHCGGVTPPNLAAGGTSVYAQYTVQVAARERVRERLHAAGIPTAVHYPLPLHHQPVFASATRHLEVAERAADRVLSLPMHAYLAESQQDDIVAALARANADSVLASTR